MNVLQQHYQGTYPKLIMFDLDGTLVDSAPDIAIAVNKTLQDLNLPAVAEESVRNWVGNGADILIRRALTNGDDNNSIDQALWDKAFKLLLEYYPYHHNANYIYQGVKPFLEFMQKQTVKMAVVTNKPVVFVEPLLVELEINQYFQWIVGGGSLPQKKPAPEPLLYVLQQANIMAEQALFIGDSRNDVRAAKAANVPCAALTYGYNHGESIAVEDPDWVIDDLRDLLK
ncbi:phosphoglycolate phosphatase [Entomomonas asaccharolytica]|uniref:Phosphoglycolate phosphatase n=1 Tax=Entomomonas asaccharolytica TaxID=2785331 RepID=A0A974NFZ2_9GAMM|nr:phosphoglycolate phosphatase [Entomomonas asaccharolytica]QQP85853.1 phosphoglycolate phosphatase [Entomomonas asaccharolytica]